MNIIDTQALTLLLDLLIAGTSYPCTNPAYTPPPQHLSLASTLLIHPSVTTRAISIDRRDVSIVSLRLLRSVLKQVGPVNASLDVAFAFTTPAFNSRRNRSSTTRRGRDTASEHGGMKGETDSNLIMSNIARQGGIWAKADDFWHCVGWGFNCASKHPKRWTQWKVWLEFMVGALEDDWTERWRQYKIALESKWRIDRKINGDRDGSENSEDGSRLLQESMIATYISCALRQFGGPRRLVRSLFADGSANSLNEFGEIFSGETKSAPQDSSTRLLTPRILPDDPSEGEESKIDINADLYGDYLDNRRSSSSSPEPNVQVTTSAPFTEGLEHSSPRFSGPDIGLTHPLRSRLMSLISLTSFHFSALELSSAQASFEILPLDGFYNALTEHVRPLPLPAFFLFATHTQLRALHSDGCIMLWEGLLEVLLPASAPIPSSVRTKDRGTEENVLTQNVLETCYLPFPSNNNNLIDNAKVSLLLEGLVGVLFARRVLVWTKQLQDALENGIETRIKKAHDGRRKMGIEESRIWLRDSAERLRGYMSMLQSGVS